MDFARRPLGASLRLTGEGLGKASGGEVALGGALDEIDRKWRLLDACDVGKCR